MATKKQIRSQRYHAKAHTMKIVRISAYLLATVLLNVLLIYFLGNSQQVRDDRIATKILTIDEVGSVQEKNYHHTTTQYFLRSGSDQYWFDKSSIMMSGYKLSETVDTLEKGQQVTVSYIHANTKVAPRIIVDAYSDEQVYCTLAGYNKNQLISTVLHIALYFIFSCIISFAVIYFEGWLEQWIDLRNAVIKENKRVLYETAKAARRAEQEALPGNTSKKVTRKLPK